MGREILKIEFLVDSDEMTTEEWENQQELDFIVTEDMLIDLVRQFKELPEGCHIDSQNFFISKI